MPKEVIGKRDTGSEVVAAFVQKNPSLFNLVNQVINIAIIIPLVMGAMQFSKMATKMERMNKDVSTVQKNIKSISDSVQSTQQNLRELTLDFNRTNASLLGSSAESKKEVRRIADDLDSVINCIKTRNFNSRICRDIK